MIDMDKNSNIFRYIFNITIIILHSNLTDKSSLILQNLVLKLKTQAILYLRNY